MLIKTLFHITKAVIAEGKKELKDIYVRDMTKVAADTTIQNMIKKLKKGNIYPANK